MDLVCIGDVMLDVHVASGALARGGDVLLQEPGHEVAVAAIGGVRTPLLAVEAASWPLLETLGVERFFEETAVCDVVLANEREARVLTGTDGEDAARVLGARYRFAAVKRASNGATLIADGRLVAADGAVSEEVESTGAGGAFDGGPPASVERGAAP